jgi:hypothetical protein
LYKVSKPVELANKIMEDDSTGIQRKLMKPCMLEENGMTFKTKSGLYRLFYRLGRHRRNFIFYDDIIEMKRLAGVIV